MEMKLKLFDFYLKAPLYAKIEVNPENFKDCIFGFCQRFKPTRKKPKEQFLTHARPKSQQKM
jgi:hypothetical protein